MHVVRCTLNVLEQKTELIKLSTLSTSNVQNSTRNVQPGRWFPNRMALCARGTLESQGTFPSPARLKVRAVQEPWAVPAWQLRFRLRRAGKHAWQSPMCSGVRMTGIAEFIQLDKLFAQERKEVGFES